MGEVTIEYLGEQVRLLQADMRAVKRQLDGHGTLLKLLQSTMTNLIGEVATEMSTTRSDVRELREDIDARFKALEASLDARFAQANESAATNFRLLLAAIEGSKGA